MRLIEVRKERGLSQKEAAARLGIPLSTYRKYEYEERQIPVDVLAGIADSYDVSIDYLVGRDMMEGDMQKAQLSSIFDMLDPDGRTLLVTIARALVKSGDYLSI